MAQNILKFLNQHAPWTEILETLDALVESGASKDTALDMITGLIDKALPLDTLVSGPAGVALETLDGPVLRALLGLLWGFAVNTASREARKIRRARKLATVVVPRLPGPPEP